MKTANTKTRKPARRTCRSRGPDIRPKLLDEWQLEADLSILHQGTGAAYRRVKGHIRALEHALNSAGGEA